MWVDGLIQVILNASRAALGGRAGFSWSPVAAVCHSVEDFIWFLGDFPLCQKPHPASPLKRGGAKNLQRRNIAVFQGYSAPSPFKGRAGVGFLGEPITTEKTAANL